MLTHDNMILVTAEGEVIQPVGRLIQRDSLDLTVAFNGPEQHLPIVAGGIETSADKL